MIPRLNDPIRLFIARPRFKLPTSIRFLLFDRPIMQLVVDRRKVDVEKHRTSFFRFLEIPETRTKDERKAEHEDFSEVFVYWRRLRPLSVKGKPVLLVHFADAAADAAGRMAASI